MDEQSHPDGWRKFKRQDCCFKQKPLKACQMGHVECIPEKCKRGKTKHFKRMVWIAARFGQLDVLRILPVTSLEEDDIIESINVAKTLACVHYLSEHVTMRDEKAMTTLSWRCGKRHLRTAVYFSLRYGWSEIYGEYLATNYRFNVLVDVMLNWNYRTISRETVSLCLKNCSNYSVSFSLLKMFAFHYVCDEFECSNEMKHALRAL